MHIDITKIYSKIKKEIKYLLGGREYGVRQTESIKKTPEGREFLETYEKEGFWKMLKKAIKNR